MSYQKRITLFIGILATLPLLFFATIAFADALVLREKTYAPIFERVGAHFAIPPALLQAIARQESGCNPLLINVQGKDFRPTSKEEALKLCQAADTAGVQYDVGLMQINRYWIHKYKLPHSLLLNAHDNIYTGGFILHKEIKRSGLSWKAVGNYHSPTPARAQAYAHKIRGHLTKILQKSPL